MHSGKRQSGIAGRARHWCSAVAKTRQKLKGRRESGAFGRWPHACAVHPSYSRLTIPARALLLDLIGQFNGFNNGNLTTAFTVLKPMGWKSRTTVDKACGELEKAGWIVRTRQGGKNRCNLYALTYAGIDRCPDESGNHKLDVPPNPVALGFWKEGRNPWLEREQTQRPKGNGLISKPSCWATHAHVLGKSSKSEAEIDPVMPTKWASQAENSPSSCPAAGHPKESTKGCAVDS